MKRLLVFAALFLILATAAPAQYYNAYNNAPPPLDLGNPAVHRCDADADCVEITVSPCSGPVVINGEFLGIAAARYTYLMAHQSCRVQKINPFLKAGCLNHICNFVPDRP